MTASMPTLKPVPLTSTMHDEDAEQAVLSALLMGNDRTAVTARAELPPSAFYFERHRHLYEAMLAVHNDGAVIDPLSVASKLERQGRLDQCGGKDYLGYLLDVVPTDVNVTHHARLVRDEASRRAIVEILTSSARILVEEGLTARDAAQRVFNALLPHTVDGHSPGFRHVKEFLWSTMEAIEKRTQVGNGGLLTGYSAIDNHTGGFRPTELVILGGAEKSGKTAIALNIAQRILERGEVGAGVISAEMSAESLVERTLSRKSGVQIIRMAKGEIRDDDFPKLARAAGEVASWPLHIDDEAEPALSDVIARASHLKAMHPEIGLIVVDFLQLVTARERGQNESAELKRIAYGLKGLAKRLGVVVIAPCQVNSKEVEDLKVPKPRLKDLQGSSGMRQAADFIGLVYREKLYNDLADDSLEIDFAACRRTPSFLARLRFDGSTMTVHGA